MMPWYGPTRDGSLGGPVSTVVWASDLPFQLPDSIIATTSSRL